jgi:putative restriction endonuclease
MFAISPTDNHWFQFLRDAGFNSYVNFWTPTPWNIKRMSPGNRWYFLLKSPIREIGGFGEFVEYKNLTAIEAWKEYGQRNGCVDKKQMVERIQVYIDKNSEEFGGKSIDINSHEIGCVILKNCQFWDEEKYKRPEDYEIGFATQVVKYKYFDQYDPFTNLPDDIDNFSLLNEPREEFKKEVNQRKGQSEFKGRILKAYNNKCCVSGETCPELLEAAHLQQYLNDSSNHIQNGILLRIDLHRLFDNGLLFIDNEYKVHISPILLSPSYKQFEGIKISLPNNPNEYPSKECLELKRKDFRI